MTSCTPTTPTLNETTDNDADVAMTLIFRTSNWLSRYFEAHPRCIDKRRLHFVRAIGGGHSHREQPVSRRTMLYVIVSSQWGSQGSTFSPASTRSAPTTSWSTLGSKVSS